jgi:hypothetical protein
MKQLVLLLALSLSIMLTIGCAHRDIDEHGKGRGFWNTLTAVGAVVAFLWVGQKTS